MFINQHIETTINAFFKSVYDYIAKNSALYSQKSDKQAIEAQTEIIKNQERNIAKMIYERKLDFDAYKLNNTAWEIKSAGCPGYQAFMKPGSVDNSALVAYREVINGITEYIYYGLREEVLLKPLKQWNYVISNRPLKDLVYPFMPLKHFIVKGTQR